MPVAMTRAFTVEKENWDERTKRQTKRPIGMQFVSTLQGLHQIRL
jgi:hypothetical protein